MMASGKLSSSPKINPFPHPGSGSRAAPITNPMANRFRNAPIKAAVLSAKVSGSIDAADKVPYTRPQIVPRSSRDIVNSLQAECAALLLPKDSFALLFKVHQPDVCFGSDETKIDL